MDILIILVKILNAGIDYDRSRGLDVKAKIEARNRILVQRFK